MKRRKSANTGPTNKETRALKKEYPAGTVIEFIDKHHAQRAGLVIGAKGGMLEVRAPALVAKMPRKTWGVTEPYPTKYHVPRKNILYVLTIRGRPKYPEADEKAGQPQAEEE